MAGGLGQLSDELESFEDINRELEPSSINYTTGAFAPVVLSAGLNTVLIRFTEEQYKWLLSSAITGAFIIYPENPLSAVFPLLECVDMPIDSCLQVQNCIENNPDVRDALGRWFRDTEYNDRLERALEELKDLVTGYNGSDTCNEDELFGAITAVFDELNQSAVDWLEILEASAQVVELLSEWGEELAALAIASSGSLAAAVAIAAVFATVIEQFILDLIQNYQASYSTELRDELRCEFLCHALALDCSFTAFEILAWIEPQITFSAQTLPDLVAWFFGLTIDISRQTVLRMWYFELSLYRFAINNTLASIFVGVPARNALVRLSQVAQAAPNDDAWTIICDPCSTAWEFAFDFSVGNGGWEAAPATYVSGQYWQGNDIVTVLPQRRRQLGLIRNFASTTITGFTVNTAYTRGSFNSLAVLALRFWVGLDATPEFQISAAAVGTPPYSGYTVNNLSIITTQVRLAHITSQQNSNSFSGTNRILSIVLRGEGVNPFI